MNSRAQLSLEAIIVFACLISLIGMVVMMPANNGKLAGNSLKSIGSATEALKCSTLIDLSYVNNLELKTRELDCKVFDNKAIGKNGFKVIILNDFTSTVKEGEETKLIVGGRHYAK